MFISSSCYTVFEHNARLISASYRNSSFPSDYSRQEASSIKVFPSAPAQHYCFIPLTFTKELIPSHQHCGEKTSDRSLCLRLALKFSFLKFFFEVICIPAFIDFYFLSFILSFFLSFSFHYLSVPFLCYFIFPFLFPSRSSL